MDFDMIKKAGLGQQEFADLVGVSRITVNKWVSGKNPPSRHVEQKVKQQLGLLTAATRLKYLPGDIPTMHKNNVLARRDYIRDKLVDTAAKIRERKERSKAVKK